MFTNVTRNTAPTTHIAIIKTIIAHPEETSVLSFMLLNL
jgi:hypothetical protein